MSEEYFAEVLRDKRAGKQRSYPLDGMQLNGDLYRAGVLIDHLRGPGGPVIDSERFNRRVAGVSFREQDNAAAPRGFVGADGCREVES